MARLVLDTNVFSYALRRDQKALTYLRTVANQNDEVLMCPVTYWELRRGLLYRDAHGQMARLLAIVAGLPRQDYTRDMWGRAAQLWSDGRKGGVPVENMEADILIAAFAIELAATVVTANPGDFQPLAGVQVVDWATV